MPLFGGQLALTTEVENFPGFPDGVLGPELMELMKRQAERFGAEIRIGEVSEVELTRYPLRLNLDGELLETKTLIIATGATARLLDVPGEATFFGKGVSTCATCDGFFYRGKTVAVVGGGDSAVEEGTFLTRYASKVYVVHRRDRLRASQILQDRAMQNEKISFIWDTVIEEIIGRGRYRRLRRSPPQCENRSRRGVAGGWGIRRHRPYADDDIVRWAAQA